MKMWVVPYGLISLFLLIVGIWHLHMPGSFNSIMPSEANNLDDWIKLPRWMAGVELALCLHSPNAANTGGQGTKTCG